MTEKATFLSEIEEKQQETTNAIARWGRLMEATQVHVTALMGNVNLLDYCMLKVDNHSKVMLLC